MSSGESGGSRFITASRVSVGSINFADFSNSRDNGDSRYDARSTGLAGSFILLFQYVALRKCGDYGFSWFLRLQRHREFLACSDFRAVFCSDCCSFLRLLLSDMFYYEREEAEEEQRNYNSRIDSTLDQPFHEGLGSQRTLSQL